VRNFGPPPIVSPGFAEGEAGEGDGLRSGELQAELPVLDVGVSSPGGGEGGAVRLPPSLLEMVSLGATDSLFFCKTFFPKTFRQDFAPLHRKVWDLLDDPKARFPNIILPRDFAKTTTLRAYAGKRIAYGISRTVVYVGKSEKHARRSVRWLRMQIEVNKPLVAAFGLGPGRTWTDEEIEIKHGPEGHSVWVIALGITGSTRGINIDDYRPDLIIIDDVVDGQNSATKEQREKIADLVLADLKDSLQPETEAPDAKMVLLNTPQDFEDISQRALKDEQFTSARFPCWTPETLGLPLEFQESAWPARYPSAALRRDKKGAIARNKLSLWMKEKEVELISPEDCAFRHDWLQYFGIDEQEPEPPKGGRWVEMAIDPVPPPTEQQIAKGFAKKDYEAFVVACRWDGAYYILETIANRGHEPNWTVNTFFSLCLKWNPRKIIVETVAYQKTLEWLLREAMRTRGRYWVITPFDDKRRKLDVIVDGLSGPASNGQLYIRRNQFELISQFLHYPGKNPDGDHDDVLNAAAIVVASLEKGQVSQVLEDQYKELEERIPVLDYERGAP